jgi:hypothetical protein
LHHLSILNSKFTFALLDFFNTISSGGTNFTAWGLSGDQPGDAVGYITGVILANYAIPAISQAFSQGGDIITTRTVHQWLWDCRDPLLQILQPTENDCSLQHNNTLEAPNTVKTGKGDIKEVRVFPFSRNDDEVSNPNMVAVVMISLYWKINRMRRP